VQKYVQENSKIRARSLVSFQYECQLCARFRCVCATPKSY